MDHTEPHSSRLQCSCPPSPATLTCSPPFPPPHPHLQREEGRRSGQPLHSGGACCHPPFPPLPRHAHLQLHARQRAMFLLQVRPVGRPYLDHERAVGPLAVAPAEAHAVDTELGLARARRYDLATRAHAEGVHAARQRRRAAALAIAPAPAVGALDKLHAGGIAPAA
eukprot:356395-Chlamydomonas_euryale.AAC.9